MKEDYQSGVEDGFMVVGKLSTRNKITKYLREMKETGDIDWYVIGLCVGYRMINGEDLYDEV